tara:strand:+ start:641 stop:814 length:174 start_codon:yes stop_codon:yes gene_type:complete
MEENPRVWITVEGEESKTYETELSPVVFTDLVVQLVEGEILGFSIYRIDKDKKIILH